MDPALLGSLLALVGVVVAAALGYLGIRYTQRQSSLAAERTAEAKKMELELEDQRGDLARIGSLREEVSDLRVQMREDRAEYRAEIVTVRDRVSYLEQDRVSTRFQLDSLTRYVRLLMGLLKKANIDYPSPPVGLEDSG